MANQFAAGKIAVGFCDRCNFRFKLSLLKSETVRGKDRHNRVCPSCWDLDHPQNFQGAVPVSDAQALRNARPDPSMAESRVIPPVTIDVADIPKFN